MTVPRYLLKYPHPCPYSHLRIYPVSTTGYFEGLVAICPTGAVAFISQLYADFVSDQAITCDYGILELIETGDSIMADKGFDITYDVTYYCVVQALLFLNF